MHRFAKPPTCFQAALRTGRFRPLTNGVRTTFDNFKLETNNAQRSRRAPTTMLGCGAAVKELEAKWSNRYLGLRNALLRDCPEEQATMLYFLENQVKSLSDGHEDFLKYFKKKQERYDKCTKELIRECFERLVGSSQLCLTPSFLIFQQGLALEERTKRMKLEGKYNVQGALGV